MKILKAILKPVKALRQWRDDRAWEAAETRRLVEAAKRGDWQLDEMMIDRSVRLFMYVDPPVFHPRLQESVRAELLRQAQLFRPVMGKLTRLWRKWDPRKMWPQPETLVRPVFGREFRSKEFFAWRFEFRQSHRRSKLDCALRVICPLIKGDRQLAEGQSGWEELRSSSWWRARVLPLLSQQYSSRVLEKFDAIKREEMACLEYIIEELPRPAISDSAFSGLPQGALIALHSCLTTRWEEYAQSHRQAYEEDHVKTGEGYEPYTTDKEDIHCPVLEAKLEKEAMAFFKVNWSRYDFKRNWVREGEEVSPLGFYLRRFRFFKYLIGLKVLSTAGKGVLILAVAFYQMASRSEEDREAKEREYEALEARNLDILASLTSRPYTPEEMLEYIPGELTSRKEKVFFLPVNYDMLGFFN